MEEKNYINYFAETNFRNRREKFGIKLDDRRKHTYIIGKTGMGKTTLMGNLALQDIRNGYGLAFIDPHGEQAEELLNCVPKERIKDVVYFNPADIDWPIGFNIMEVKDVNTRHLIASGLMGVFKKIWPDVWSARMEYILSNSILALLEYPESTLLGINRMLSDVDYRKLVVDRITDPVVKSFWTKEFARYTQRYEVEASAAIQNKVGQFASNPLIRNIIGQPHSTIDMRDIMDAKKILIVNLSKGRIGEANSALLGALIITKIYLAAMSRVDILEQHRQDFFLYVDEFQNFATESFASILSEARKYRLSLTLAHQYIAQMEDVVREAVFGNAGTIISFRVGAEDAEYLEKEFAPVFFADDFVNLSKYNIYLKLMIDGIAGRPFSATTLPPIPVSEGSFREEIIKSSRENYAIAKAKINDMIIKWSGVEDGSRPFSGTRRKREAYNNYRNRPRQENKSKQAIPKKADNSISIKEAVKKDSIPFSIPKNHKKSSLIEKKGVNLIDLKQALNEALDEGFSKKNGALNNKAKEKSNAKDKKLKEDKKDQKGVLKPGEKIIFD